MIASYECDLKQALRMPNMHGGRRNIGISGMALSQRQASGVSAGNRLYQATTAFPVTVPLQVISTHFQMCQRVQLADGKAHALQKVNSIEPSHQALWSLERNNTWGVSCFREHFMSNAA